MKYFDELKRTMEWVAKQSNVLFIGQATGVAGTFMFNTIKNIDESQRVEFPVSEAFQMQFTVGMAMTGYVPISIYPRLNFLTLAMGELSCLVDKAPDIWPHSHPKIIIRSAVGPDSPVHPGHQHVGDFTEAFKLLFKNIDVIKLEEPEDIFPAYEKAINPLNKRSSLIIEVGNYYNEK